MEEKLKEIISYYQKSKEEIALTEETLKEKRRKDLNDYLKRSLFNLRNYIKEKLDFELSCFTMGQILDARLKSTHGRVKISQEIFIERCNTLKELIENKKIIRL